MEKLPLIIKCIRYIGTIIGFVTAVALLAETNEKSKRKKPMIPIRWLSFGCVYFELAAWLSSFLESWQEHDIFMMILSFCFFVLFVSLAIFVHKADACRRKREKEQKLIQMKEEQENE